jgi:hypothetical protein
MGACNTPLEKYFQNLSSGILKAPKFLKFQLVNQIYIYIYICIFLVTSDQGGQMNRNGKTTAILFYHIFY